MGVAQGLSNVDIQDFDFNILYKSVKSGSEAEAFSVNYKNSLDGNTIYSLVVFRNSKNELLSPMLVKCIQGRSIDYGLINDGQKVIIENGKDETFSKVVDVYSNKSSKTMYG
ncbi:MAG: hypothetical protein U5N85_17105 [Arcicella sp.]|nr:hypothetical protein [Arcicella sp.]